MKTLYEEKKLTHAIVRQLLIYLYISKTLEIMPDAKSDDDGVYLILLGVALKQMV